MADTTLKEGTRLDGLLNDHILYTDGGFEICGLAEHDAALIHEELRALRESHDALHGLLGEWMYEMGSDCHAGDEFRCENCLPCRSAAAWVAALEKAQAAAMEAQG